MKRARLMAFVIALSAAVSIAPASATTESTDQSDLWWNPAESGWGMQLVHRGGFIFATMFIYDSAGKPTWYTGQLTNPGSSDDFVWAGDVYATTGPYFGAPLFDPSTGTLRKAGTMQWTSTAIETGTLAYTIDGVTTTKELVRQTLRREDLTGEYMGAVHTNTQACNPGSGGANGDAFKFANLKAVQNGADLTLTFTPQGGSACTFIGTSTQYGQFAWAKGTYSCVSGEQGTMEVYEARVAWSEMSGRYTAKSTNFNCLTSAEYSGVWVK